MKDEFVPGCVWFALLAAATPGFTQTLTKAERGSGTSELHARREQFLDLVAGFRGPMEFEAGV
jgi:hypothetical protein